MVSTVEIASIEVDRDYPWRRNELNIPNDGAMWLEFRWIPIPVPSPSFESLGTE